MVDSLQVSGVRFVMMAFLLPNHHDWQPSSLFWYTVFTMFSGSSFKHLFVRGRDCVAREMELQFMLKGLSTCSSSRWRT